MDNICLTYENETFVYWKLFSIEQKNREEIFNGIMEICARFKDKFFRISRGNTEQLLKDCEEVLSSLEDFIPNIHKQSFPLRELSEQLFNSFNLELMELQVQKARNLISEMKQVYTFHDYHERILLSNLKYVDKEREFLNYVFELKEFRAELIKKHFIEKLHYFMQEFNESTKDQIDVKCCSMEEEFIYEVGIMVAMKKRKIEEFFYDLAGRNYCVLALKNIQVNCEDSLVDWVNQYCGVYEVEEFRLMQVVMLAPKNFIALIHLKKLAKSLIVSITPEGASKFKGLIEDPDVIIATGSTKENCIVLYNTTRILVKGFILKNKQFCESKRFNIEGGPGRILSAGYLRLTDEVLFINDSRVVCHHSFTNKPRSISHLEHYSYCKIESNGEFLFLYKPDEVNLVDSLLERIYMESKERSHCFLTGKTLILANFDGRNTLESTRIEIADEYFTPGNSVKNLLVKAKYELKANFQNSKNLLNSILSSNSYIIEKPELSNPEESKNQ